jgi:asparagine synthase (glutamine-hydrolysing)
MCGLAGFFSPTGLGAEDAAAVVGVMASAIAHRGPDDSGVWVDGEAGIALGHRRLSVLDLSPAGHQPMKSASGRFVVVFNGEIYNHLRLRAELGQHLWRGHSDTETLLAGVEHWGLAITLQKTVGMFAIALWDRERRALTLARDRMGEKPLYFGWQGNSFLFGSELKAFRVHREFRAEVERDVLFLYLRHLAVPAPYSIYRGICKLVPGATVTVSSRTPPGALPEPVPYWSLRQAVVAAKARPFTGGDAQAVAELEARLADAVTLQRVADVPLGAFLSGGIDSSAVVATMQAQSSRPVKTFAIGFHESGYNEAHHAKDVARHLGTDHTELYVTSAEAMAIVPRLPSLYDEPFADCSQIPTFLVAQLARQHVTVSLSGDGGDELFGGYGRYLSASRFWRKMQLLPESARRAAARALRFALSCLPEYSLDRVRLIPARRLRQSLRERVFLLTEALECKHPDAFYRLMISQWREPIEVLSDGREPVSLLTSKESWPRIASFEERMMYADTSSYLLDDILVKIDRAAMAVSLESRIPLLDHRLVEFSWSLPLSMKIRDGQGKWLLRELLYKYVPRELVTRPKMGFAVPVDHWLRGPLREWAETLLSEDGLKRGGFFNPKPIRLRWEQHVSGQCNWRDSLWAILMFQAWLQAGPATIRVS